MNEAGMLMRWRWREPPPEGTPEFTRETPVETRRADAPTGAANGAHPLVERLLALRGLDDAETARQFLEPKLTQLHDPTLLPGVNDAVERIERAVREGQPIVIYGDYDVDGITASAILWHVLSAAGARVSTYVPHRIDEGYGLNSDAIRQLASTDPKPLIVSVDCGITAIGPARVARDCGVDLIITDHHEFDPAGLPDAHTLVHPRLPAGATSSGEAYPFAQLCGAGVAFKLAWQFAKVHCGSERLPTAFRDLLLDLVSLAALGTVADVVPLVGENRVIVTHGLGQVKRTKFAGLNALIEASRLSDQRIDAFHVGFVLGPRLNACGRMGHAGDALRLLTDAPIDEAPAIAAMLSHVNDERRQTERDIVTLAQRLIDERGYGDAEQRAIVLAGENWHPGVLGIVASRLVERYARPVIMLNIDNGVAHGSARSVDGVSILEALQACADHLTHFGGHAMAAGLSLPSDRVDAFRDALVSHVNAQLSREDLVQVLDLDAECDARDVGLPVWEQIESLAPYGRANPAPVLCLRDVKMYEPARRIGQEGRHLRMTVRAGDGRSSRVLNCVGFGLGDLVDSLPAGVRVDLAFSPKVNVWQGQRRPEVHVRDVKLRRS